MLNMKSIRSGFYFDWHLESLNISFTLLKIELKKDLDKLEHYFLFARKINQILLTNSLKTSTKKP